MTRILAAVLALILAASSDAQTFTGFATDLALPGPSGYVWATTVHDDGSGPALYAGGEFRSVGTLFTAGIARWDGTSWSSVGGGMGPVTGGQPAVYALQSLGGRLYAAGWFTSAGGVPVTRLAAWDGSSWSAVPGAPDGTVNALGSDQGRLLVGGNFLHAGGVACRGIAAFDPSTSTWSAFGSGFYGSVTCFARYTEPTGSYLFVGGSGITTTSGVLGALVYRWDGTTWTGVGGGLAASLDGSVNAMIVHDEGLGPQLWVGGFFTTAGGQPARCIARWNGLTWSAVGLGGVDICPGCIPSVQALTEHDDGSGPALYVAGAFASVDGVQSPNLVRYRNGAFEGLPSTPDGRVLTLARFGGSLVASGFYSSTGSVHMPSMSSWSNGAWHALTDGGSLGGQLISTCAFDDGTGTALYSTMQPLGEFDSAGFARWAQGAWSPIALPDPAAPPPRAIAAFDDGSGSGPSIFVAGTFPSAALGTLQTDVWRWNANGWSALTTFPLDGGAPSGSPVAKDLEVFDDGTGPALFVCVSLTTGPLADVNIGKWDGTSWSPVGGGLNHAAFVMHVHDDGQGPALFVGGQFTLAGGSPANAVARWDGTNWSPLGAGLHGAGGLTGIVDALCTFDDGSGSALYVGGLFQDADGVPVANIARWKNGTWSAVGGGLSGTSAEVLALAVFDDGTGSALYATGIFTFAGNTQVRSLARWNGHEWQDVDGGLADKPIQNGGTPPTRGGLLAVHEEGGSSSLWIGGNFGSAGGVASYGVARLFSAPGHAFCTAGSSSPHCPCGNDAPPGAVVGCLHSSGSGGALAASGTPSLTHDSIALSGTGMTNSSALYFQGTQAVAGGAGAVFGDGLRCAGGSIVRIGTTTNVAGASVYPFSGASPSLHVKGNVAAPGSRTYQVWYRNAAPFCTPSTFNLTNGWSVTWTP